jgi:oxygen-dependent protoporphyrinogen oxidase
MILPFIDDSALGAIANLKYARVVQVSLGFKKWNGMLLDGFGGLIPHSENRDILGVLFPSAFLSGRTPEGGALLSVFMGGIRNDDIFDLSDNRIQSIVEREIQDLMGLKEFKPDLFNISRYHHAIPQYGADSEARINAVNRIQNKYKGLYVAGNLRNGIGMADRIKQGFDLAEELLS